MADPTVAEVDQARLIAETTSRGENLRAGDYLSVWEEGDHPYGQPSPCPFCKKAQTYTSFWYNGPGSPPSYSVLCENCGAQGPTSNGRFRGDHYGAIGNALGLWNEATDNAATADGADRALTVEEAERL